MSQSVINRCVMGGAVLAVAATFATGCAVGPPYRRPPVAVPDAFKEQPPPAQPGSGIWKVAEPRDGLPPTPWWEVYNDPMLTALEAQIGLANQNVALAEARFRAARAAIRLSRSGLYPTVTAGVSASARRTVQPGTAGATTGDYSLPIDLSYEVDLWGRIRRGVEANIETAQATAGDLATAHLSMQAELAVDYFALRGLDAERDLLLTTAAGYEKALQLTISRHDQGVASGVDVAQAQTQLAVTRAQATDLTIARAQLEHAVAVLIGQPPARVAIAPSATPPTPPTIPESVPSALLERRPDVAAEERRVAAANAAVGAARSAFFPTLAISAAAGLESSTIAEWFTWPSRFWSLGPSLVATAFDGGRRRAATDQARANYDAAVAIYRQNVLDAFADVEDSLAAARILAQEATEQSDAVRAAETALRLATERYQAGITTYLEVITAQAAALASERTAVDLLARRMTASVQLIKALGGGWRVSDLPAPGALLAKPTSRGQD